MQDNAMQTCFARDIFGGYLMLSGLTYGRGWDLVGCQIVGVLMIDD